MIVAAIAANKTSPLSLLDKQELLGKCQEYLRPDPLVVTGKATKVISPELISIDFGVETLDL